MIINVQTGEVLDWSQATEEEILEIGRASCRERV